MMFKRSLMVGLISFACLAAFACEDDKDKNDLSCESLKCDQIVGGKTHICAVVSGVPSCMVACLGSAEGENKAVCYSNPSLPPESRPVYSSVDTCSKDDNGKLYSVSVVDKPCSNGCDETSGLCND